jgi:hypothetical protein
MKGNDQNVQNRSGLFGGSSGFQLSQGSNWPIQQRPTSGFESTFGSAASTTGSSGLKGMFHNHNTEPVLSSVMEDDLSFHCQREAHRSGIERFESITALPSFSHLSLEVRLVNTSFPFLFYSYCLRYSTY